MPTLQKLLAEQEKLRSKQDQILKQIKKTMKEEQSKRYCDAARELEAHFISDPELEDIHQLLSIFQKHFSTNQSPSINESSTVSVTKEKRGGK